MTSSKVWSAVKTNMAREKILTISNIAIMTLTFLLLGAFITVVVLSRTALIYLEDQAQLTIFFEDAFTEERILSLADTLDGDTRVSSVNYVSKDEAFEIFTEINKEEPLLLESIPANVLPASLEVRTNDLNDLEVFANEYRNMEGVEDVRYFEEVIDRFKTLSSSIYSIGVLLVLIFFTISYSIVIATLRTTINSKGDELAIMKLVGASDSYVRAPLVAQGLFFGLVSSLAASLLLFIGALLLRGLNPFGFSGDPYRLFITDTLGFELLPYVLIMSVLLVISGVLLGYFGSLTAVKRYLKY